MAPFRLRVTFGTSQCYQRTPVFSRKNACQTKPPTSSTLLLFIRGRSVVTNFTLLTANHQNDDHSLIRNPATWRVAYSFVIVPGWDSNHNENEVLSRTNFVVPVWKSDCWMLMKGADNVKFRIEADDHFLSYIWTELQLIRRMRNVVYRRSDRWSNSSMYHFSFDIGRKCTGVKYTYSISSPSFRKASPKDCWLFPTVTSLISYFP